MDILNGELNREYILNEIKKHSEKSMIVGGYVASYIQTEISEFKPTKEVPNVDETRHYFIGEINGTNIVVDPMLAFSSLKMKFR